MTAPSGLLMARMVVPETEDATLTGNPPRDLDRDAGGDPDPDGSPQPNPPSSGPPVGEASPGEAEGARRRPQPPALASKGATPATAPHAAVAGMFV